MPVNYSYYDLNKLIYNPESEEKTAMTNKFNPKSEPTKLFLPKPGDKIICNNGEEFICCTLGFLQENIAKFISSDKPILGYWKYKHNNTWQDWDEHGNASYDNDNCYDIREVIPQNSEVTDDKKEEVKEEPRYKAATPERPLYTLQEIKEAWDNSSDWWDDFKNELMKINNPEYKEYLRLKAIYE